MPNQFDANIKQLILNIFKDIMTPLEESAGHEPKPIPANNNVTSYEVTLNDDYLISNSKTAEVRKHAVNADIGPTTQNFIDRVTSYVKAAAEIHKDEKIAEEKFNEKALIEEFKDFISAELLVDEVLHAESPKLLLQKQIETLNEKNSLFNKKFFSKSENENYIKVANDCIKAKQKFLEEKSKLETSTNKSKAKYFEKAKKKYLAKRSIFIAAACERFNKYVDSYVFLKLIATFIRENESYPEALARLRQAEIDLISSQSTPILVSTFTAPNITENENEVTRFFDIEIPIGHFTKEQKEKLDLGKDKEVADTNSGYKRDDEGVSGLKIQAVGHYDADRNPVIDQVVFRHSSPVPMDVKIDEPRQLAMTTRNAEQIRDVLANIIFKAEGGSKAYTSNNPMNIQFTELRLLSVNNKHLDDMPGFKEQKQYLQILETYFAFHMLDEAPRETSVTQLEEQKAAIKSKAHASVFSIGVNAGRHKFLTDDMRAWTNTRAANELYDRMYQYCEKIESDTQKVIIANPILKESDNIHTLTSKLSLLIKLAISPETDKIEKKLNIYKQRALVGRLELQKQFSSLKATLDRYELAEQHLANARSHSDIEAVIFYQKEIDALKVQYQKQTQLLMKQIQLHHNEAEKPLNDLRREEWHKSKKQIKRELANLKTQIESNKEASPEQIEFYKFAQDYVEAMDLMYGKRWGESFWRPNVGSQYYKKENNYLLQTRLARLNNMLGSPVFSGCNDDKDRGGRYLLTFEAQEAFFIKMGRYPQFDNPDDRKKMDVLINAFQSQSVILYHTEKTSAPGALGFEIHAGDGNENMNLENKPMAVLGKGQYVHATDREKELNSYMTENGISRKKVVEQTQLSSDAMITNQLQESTTQTETSQKQTPKPFVPTSKPSRAPTLTAMEVFKDFATTTIFHIMQENDGFAEMVLIHYQDKLIKLMPLSEQDALNKVLISTLTSSDEDKLAIFGATFNATYMWCIAQASQLFVEDFLKQDKAWDKKFTKFLSHQTPHEGEDRTLDEPTLSYDQLASVQRLKDINGILKGSISPPKEEDSIFYGDKWKETSYRFGSKRSLNTQMIDHCVQKYIKADNGEEEKTALIQLIQAIQHWNEYHQLTRTSSRRQDAVDQLYAEAIAKLKKFEKSPSPPINTLEM